MFKRDGKLRLLSTKEKASDFCVNECTACHKVLKNKGGLLSHQQHCKLFLKERSLEQAKRATLYRKYMGTQDKPICIESESPQQGVVEACSNLDAEEMDEDEEPCRDKDNRSVSGRAIIVNPQHVCCGIPCEGWPSCVVESDTHACSSCGRHNHVPCGFEAEHGYAIDCKPSCELARAKVEAYVCGSNCQKQSEASTDATEGVLTPREQKAKARGKKSKPTQRGRQHRNSYTLKRKAFAIKLVEDVINRTNKIRGAKRKVADLLDIPETNINKWVQNKVKIVEDYSSTLGRRGNGNRGIQNAMCIGRGSKQKYALAEQVVYDKIMSTRKEGGRVSGHTIRRWIRAEVKLDHERLKRMRLISSSIDFKASNRWLSRFTRSFNLSLRRKTNCKSVSIDKRLPKIKRFHARLKLRLQRRSNEPGEKFDVCFGRWLPEHRFNVDQVPCPLECAVAQTYDKRGTTKVHIRSKGADASKRFCTFQVCMRLTSDKTVPQPPLGIIFRGTGKRISEAERSNYHPQVHVEFQSKAWADTEYSVSWITRTLKKVQEDVKGESLLFLDNLSSQTSEAFIKEARKVNVRVHFFPANCTDLIQPVDHHVGVNLKRKVGIEMEKEFEKNSEFEKRWLGTHIDGPLKLSERRVAITRWAGVAWGDLCREMDFGKIGYSTGCNMTINNKHVDPVTKKEIDVPKIKIEGVDNYTFDDVQITDYPEESDVELTDDESDKEENDDLDEFEIGSEDDRCADEEVDDTDYVDVDVPSVDLIQGYTVIEEYPGLTDLLGKLVYFKLNAPGTKRTPGWYLGRVDKPVTSQREKAQGYNFNLKFTRSTTKQCARPFNGTIAVLLNKETYGLTKQYFFVNKK